MDMQGKERALASMPTGFKQAPQDWFSMHIQFVHVLNTCLVVSGIFPLNIVKKIYVAQHVAPAADFG